MTKVLVVEDDVAILRGLVDNLRAQGYEVQSAPDGEEGYSLAKTTSFDLLLLDVMLPKMSGFELCELLRSEGCRVPILMLTARAEESDRIHGLDLGADDYITKPFSLRELLARVRAILRRSSSKPDLPETAEFGEIRVDFRRFEAARDGIPVKLTRKEFGTLRFLISRRGDVVSRSELLEEVWDYREYPTRRTVDNHIASLRAKIESEPNNPRHLLTVHGVGYKFVT